jgi:L-amino acid N-acyltransferase YncA
MLRRDARPADLPAIVAIYNATIPSRMVTADLEPVDAASRIPWFDAHSPGRHPLWVADIDGRIAAWLSFSTFHSRAAYDGTAELSIYVATEHRHRGLGRRLLADAIDHAPSIGLHTLVGLVFGHNAPSLALFESAGFARWGTLPRVAVLDGVERDLVYVGRRVAPG